MILTREERKLRSKSVDASVYFTENQETFQELSNITRNRPSSVKIPYSSKDDNFRGERDVKFNQ